MRTRRFQPAIGQRFVHQQPGAIAGIWVLTAISVPKTVVEPPELTFTEELTKRVIRRSTARFAHDILHGALAAENDRTLPVVDMQPLALSNLLAEMSPAQLRQYKMRVSYVLAVDRAHLGQSHKSQDFCLVISANHELRMAAWKKRVAGNPGTQIGAIESNPPAPTTVYRWFLQYRKAGNDVRVLANSVLAIRTRSSRKPKTKEVLQAFLSSRLSLVERTSIAELTKEFNQLIAQSDPLHTDELIERLYAQGRENAKANKLARTGGKRSLRTAQSLSSVNKKPPATTRQMTYGGTQE